MSEIKPRTEIPVIHIKHCNMGVGCDEAGICYAEAMGRPDQCPFNEEDSHEVPDRHSGDHQD